MKTEVYLGLGTNLGDREENLKKAVIMIGEMIGEVVLRSPVYRTEPWGFQSEDEFLNMVLMVATDIKPSGLLGRILRIEAHFGRLREGKSYTSRIIDIDILLYGSKIITRADLVIPHPLIQERRFILAPLCDIAPQLMHPVLNKTFATLLQECRDERNVRKLEQK